MRTIANLRIELADINVDLNRLVRKCGTKRKIAKMSLSEKEQALAELRQLEAAKQTKLLVICALNRKICFN